MLRFGVNRSWAFILALCLFTTCFFLSTVQLPSVASADPGSFNMAADDPLSPSLGDPDVPMGPGDGKVGQLSVVRNGSNQVVSQNGARLVDDGAVPSSVLMSRVHSFLLGLRSLYLRF